MSWRKWFVRALVFSIMGSCVLAGVVYQRWTNPAVVRELVMAKLQELFPGAEISLDSARMRLLGGIIVHELRLSRKDDPDQFEVLSVPSAIIYHDKEKILDGALNLRKVELNRPRLHVIRRKDGTWNLAGLMGKSDPNGFVPTVVMQQGTIRIEDERNANPAKKLEIVNISISLINDPITHLNINGSGECDVLGTLGVNGTLDRVAKQLAMNVRARALPLNDSLIRRALCDAKLLEKIDGLELKAKADVDVQVAYHAGAAEPLQFNARMKIGEGAVAHPKLPLPLTNVSCEVEYCNGTIRMPRLRATSGKTTLKGSGFAMMPRPDQFFEADLEVHGLEVSDELCSKLSDKIARLRDLYDARGPATVQVSCARREGQWVPLSSGKPSRVKIQPENARASFAKFPYPLERITGLIECNLLTKFTRVDATGYTHDRPVLIQGTFQGDHTSFETEFELQATDVPINEKLVSALPEKFEKLARSFHINGKLDFKSFIRNVPGTRKFLTEYHLYLHEGTTRWNGFPYPLENVSGFLDIYPKHWEFREGRGSHRGGAVQVEARSIALANSNTPQSLLPSLPKPSENSQPKPAANSETPPSDGKTTDANRSAVRSPGREADEEGNEVDDAKDDHLKSMGVFIEIVGRNLALDGDLRKALEPLPALGKSWDEFQPKGRIHFTATIEQYPQSKDGMDVKIDVRGGTVEPTFFPYTFTDITGYFRFFRQQLTAQNVRARHGNTVLEMDFGTIDVLPTGGHYTDLHELRVLQLTSNKDLLNALPPAIRNATETLNISDPIDLKTRLIISQPAGEKSDPDIFWDGQAWFKNTKLSTGLEWSELTGTLAATGRYRNRQLAGLIGNVVLDRAKLLNQPVRGMQAKFHMSEKVPDVLNVNLHAPLHGGDVTGQARFEFNSQMRYELNLTASQVDLEKFSKTNLGADTNLSGMAVARLHLNGQGSDIDTLDGNGSLDIPNGRIYNLPLLLDLLKFLGLRWPDRTAFEELHALFSIHGTRLNMRRLDLTGNAVSLSGKGDFNLDGTDLNLDFYPSWARIEQLLPPAVRPFPPAFSKNFLTIEMRGKVSSDPKDLKFNKKIVPALTDPLIYVRDHMLAPVLPTRGRAPSLPNLPSPASALAGPANKAPAKNAPAPNVNTTSFNGYSVMAPAVNAIPTNTPSASTPSGNALPIATGAKTQVKQGSAAPPGP